MSELIIRLCTPADLPEVLDILDERQAFMAKVEPGLWRPAADARDALLRHLSSLLDRDEHMFLVAGPAGGVLGFLIATETRASPVHDTGPVATIDEFQVVRPALWPHAGAALLAEARRRMKVRGIGRFVVTSPYRDDAKMVFLKQQKLSLHAASFNGAV